MNSLKHKEKKTNFVKRVKYAEVKNSCICVDVYKTYEGNDYDKSYEASSTIKNKKIKVNNILIEKYRGMCDNPDFEQDFYSRTAMGLYKIGHDSIRIMKWLVYLDRSYYENIKEFELMGSFLKYLYFNIFFGRNYVEVKDHRNIKHTCG